MQPLTTFFYLFIINLLLAIGDVIAKKGMLPVFNINYVILASSFWFIGCCMWFPTMRSEGFTRLIALADSMGIMLVALGGYLFLLLGASQLIIMITYVLECNIVEATRWVKLIMLLGVRNLYYTKG